MNGTKDIIQAAATLPVEERAVIVDPLLRTLNPPNVEIDRVWVRIAEHRLADLHSCRVQPVPGEQVFAKIKKRFVR
ncbi:MAG: addiction module protein [Lentisphaerae bacterium]|jgi:putative addiction module component (TIGR02574 family)|nr:addiction module protein [Lentisphaerota bacterium]